MASIGVLPQVILTFDTKTGLTALHINDLIFSTYRDGKIQYLGYEFHLASYKGTYKEAGEVTIYHDKRLIGKHETSSMLQLTLWESL